MWFISPKFVVFYLHYLDPSWWNFSLSANYRRNGNGHDGYFSIEISRITTYVSWTHNTRRRINLIGKIEIKTGVRSPPKKGQWTLYSCKIIFHTIIKSEQFYLISFTLFSRQLFVHEVFEHFQSNVVVLFVFRYLRFYLCKPSRNVLIFAEIVIHHLL